MDFTDEELRELAAFLARRLTPDLKPTSTLEAEPEVFEAWHGVLRLARSTDTLAGVVKSASEALPRDAYLREACALLNPPTRTQWVLTGGGMVVAAAVLVLISLTGFATTGVLAAIEAAGPVAARHERMVPGHDPGHPAPPTGGDATEAVAPTVAVAAASAGDDGPGAVAPWVAPEGSDSESSGAAASVPRMEDGPSEGPLEQSGSPESYGSADPDPAEPFVESERVCKVGGWVYAGRSRPPEPYVVPFAVHVRASPPTKDNGWNAKTRTRCWLRKGDVVRLSEPPLELPGGHYWVHVAPFGEDDVALADTGRPGR